MPKLCSEAFDMFYSIISNIIDTAGKRSTASMSYTVECRHAFVLTVENLYKRYKYNYMNKNNTAYSMVKQYVLKQSDV